MVLMNISSTGNIKGRHDQSQSFNFYPLPSKLNTYLLREGVCWKIYVIEEKWGARYGYCTTDTWDTYYSYGAPLISLSCSIPMTLSLYNILQTYIYLHRYTYVQYISTYIYIRTIWAHDILIRCAHSFLLLLVQS